MLVTLGLLAAGVWLMSWWHVRTRVPVAMSLTFQERGDLMADEALVDFLWPLPLMLWTTGGLSLWSGRRARRRAVEGHCPTCGYNLAGLNRDAGGVCPECGKAKEET